MRSRLIKRVIAATTSVAIIATAMVGCGSSEEKKVLNVFNWTEYIPQEVLDDFEDEYGIKVNYSTYSSNDELLAKVKSSAEGTYDLALPSDYMVTIMAKSDLLEELDLSKLSNFGNLDEVALNQSYDEGNKYSVPYICGAAPIAVNTDVIKDEITSYEDLLNPDYKDSIVLLDEQRQVVGMALLAKGYSMNDTDESHLAEAKEFLSDLKGNIRAFDSDSPKTALITGEVGIGVVWNAEIALAMQEKDNIEVVYPKEGIYLYMDNFVIPKGAKNAEYAYLFIDYILRPEVIAKVSAEFPYKVVNKAAYDILSDDYKNNEASNIPTSEMEKGEYIEDVGNDTAKFDKLWSEFKGE